MRGRATVTAVFLLLSVSLCLVHAGTVPDVERLLSRASIPADTNLLERGAVMGMLRAIDPDMQVLSVKEAETLLDGVTVVEEQAWSNGIVYVRLEGLYRGNASSLAESLESWLSGDAIGIVLDLRGSGGSDLECVDAVAALLVPGEKDLYRLWDAAGGLLETRTAPGGKRAELHPPVLLLANGETRGASELLVAVLKAQGGVMVLGQRTAGDTSLREVLPLTEDERVFMATRWASLPDQAGGTDGTDPDIDVSHRRAAPSEDSGGEDRVLQRARDILLGLHALALDVLPVTGTNRAAPASVVEPSDDDVPGDAPGMPGPEDK